MSTIDSGHLGAFYEYRKEAFLVWRREARDKVLAEFRKWCGLSENAHIEVLPIHSSTEPPSGFFCSMKDLMDYIAKHGKRLGE